MEIPNPDKGAARLNFAMENAARCGDTTAWLLAAGALYDRARSGETSEEELRSSRVALLDKVDGLRGAFRSRVGRLWAAQQVDLRIGELFSDEARCQPPDLATLFRLMEAGKSRTLLDHLGSAYIDLPEAERQDIRSLEKSILSFPDIQSADWNEREIRLHSGLPILERWGQANTRLPIRAVEDAYARASAGFSTVEPVASLEDVRLVLQPDEILVDYCLPLHPTHPAIALHGMIVTQEGVHRFALNLRTALADIGGFAGSFSINGGAPLETSQLAAVLFACRENIQAGNEEEAQVRLRRLAGLLIKPVLESGIDPKRQKHWIISPHRILHTVPWNAVIANGGEALMNDVAITLAPSASVWHKLRATTTSAPKRFVAFGNPRPLPDTSLKNLAQAEVEVSLLSSILMEQMDCKVLINQDASEAALRREVGQAGMVHFATHGAFPEQDAIDFHQLLLAPGEGFDGRVLAEELRGMDFHDASLVVLSICNGGLYRFGPGDEPYGLVPAILAAHALNIVGPLWSIADNKARQFMTTFYSHLFESGPPEALRQTCRELAQQGWLMRDWAGFVLVGNGLPLPGSENIKKSTDSPDV